MEPIPYSQLARGTFLVATPEIEEGLYFRSVVLLAEHSQAGSLGIVINKPLEIDLPADLLNVEEFANQHVQLRAGGAVQTNQMMIVHTSDRIPDKTVELTKGLFLGGDLDFLQEAVSEETGPHLILCFGYSAWGPGQLEREFLDGHWYLAPADATTLFNTPPDKLWATVLRKMGGKYATLSTLPPDLTLN